MGCHIDVIHYGKPIQKVYQNDTDRQNSYRFHTAYSSYTV